MFSNKVSLGLPTFESEINDLGLNQDRGISKKRTHISKAASSKRDLTRNSSMLLDDPSFSPNNGRFLNAELDPLERKKKRTNNLQNLNIIPEDYSPKVTFKGSVTARPKSPMLFIPREIFYPNGQMFQSPYKSDSDSFRFTKTKQQFHLPQQFQLQTPLNKSSSSGTGFISFDELIKSHRGNESDLLDKFQDMPRSKEKVTKHLQYQRTQYDNWNKNLSELQTYTHKMLDETISKKEKVEKMMPKIRIYPSKRLNKEIFKGIEGFEADDDSILSQSKDKNDYVPNVLSYNNRGLIDRKLKVFKYRPNEQVEWAPEARENSTLVAFGRYGYLFGGISGGALDTMAVVDATQGTWSNVTHRGEIPKPRCAHTAVPYKKTLIVFGGASSFNTQLKIRECYNDLFTFSTETKEWRLIKQSGAFVQARRNHVAVIFGRYMLIHGGINTYGEYLNDIKVLNLTNMKWSECFVENEEESGIAHHAAVEVFHPDRRRLSLNKMGELPQPPKLPHIPHEGIYFYGGKLETGKILNTIRVLTVGNKSIKWETLNTIGKPPEPRYAHVMVYYDRLNSLIIHGGRNDESKQTTRGAFNDIAVFHLENLNWINVTKLGYGIVPRYSHTGTLFGSRLVVFGGMNFDSFIDPSIEQIELEQTTVIKVVKEQGEFGQNNVVSLPALKFTNTENQNVNFKDDEITPSKTLVEENLTSNHVVSFLPQPTKEELQKVEEESEDEQNQISQKEQAKIRAAKRFFTTYIPNTALANSLLKNTSPKNRTSLEMSKTKSNIERSAKRSGGLA